MPIDPATMAALAPVVGGLIEAPFKIYGGLQQMKLQRAQLREQKRQGRASRLHQIMADSGGMRNNASAIGRLQALRASGGTV